MHLHLPLFLLFLKTFLVPELVGILSRIIIKLWQIRFAYCYSLVSATFEHAFRAQYLTPIYLQIWLLYPMHLKISK